MKLSVSELKQRPVFVRAAPFIVFILLLFYYILNVLVLLMHLGYHLIIYQEILWR